MIEQRVKFSALTGLALLAAMLSLNSLLTVFGSILWGYYWPAFLVYSLATVYFGWWGVLLAIATPFAASFLSIGDAPFYLYMPVNFLQAMSVAAAFHFLRIEPNLATWRDKLLYVSFGAAMPSLLGGSVAWVLRSFYPSTHDGSVSRFAAAWALENVIPSIIPGVWLYTVIGETYKSFSWESGRTPKPWIRRTFEYSAPWMLSLGLIGSMIILVIAQQLGWQQIPLKNVPGAWTEVQDRIVTHLPALRWTALAFSISLLYSLGSTIQLAKRSWVLTQAVRTHLPTSILSDTLLSGIEWPAQRRPLTLVKSEITNFNSVANLLAPDDLVAWLNSFYARMCDVCEAEGGALVNLSGSGILIVFGLSTPDSNATQALLCALSMYDQTQVLSTRLVDQKLPPVCANIAVHCGLTVAGDLGSTNRRQFSVVGQTVDFVSQMLKSINSLPDGIAPIVFSRDVALEAGILTHSDNASTVLEFSMPHLELADSMFAIPDESIATARDLLHTIRERRTNSRATI